jgi:hypothetical protein
MAKSRTTALVPAASRAPEVLTDVETVLNGQAIETFVKAVGGREQLAEVLSIAGAGGDLDKVTTYLLDPRYTHYSLRRVCGAVGITVADLFAAYKKALITRAHIEATHIIAAKLPPIVIDVMDRALTDPTVERHKLALELGQLLEKKGGLIVQQNNAMATLGSTAPGSLEQLQQAVGDLLFGDRRREDLTVTDETPGEPAEEPEEEEPAAPGEEELPDLPFGDPREPLPPLPRPRPPDQAGAPGEPDA